MDYNIYSLKTLTDKIAEYRQSYYNDNKSLISDKEYDELFDLVKDLEEKLHVSFSNSPTKQVGYKAVSILKKVKHDHPMLSLDKTKSIDELVHFVNKAPAILMAKMDGLTISLTYEKGRLSKAETRGDGEIGEDVLHNAEVFDNIPLSIPHDGKYVIDGEAIITEDTFDAINLKESTAYKNARNLASGSVRQLDSKIAANRHIRFIAWKVVEGSKLEWFSSRLDEAKEYGFEIVETRDIASVPISSWDSHSLQFYIDEITAECANKAYGIDGIVASYDNVLYSESLGSTQHHVNYQIAFKFYDENHDTVLRDIEWNTSRTGQINPVAIFDPVQIDGTTISRATLCNVDIIKTLQLGIGDIISVRKANMIIPQIVRNKTRSNTYQIPAHCPACGGKATVQDIFLECLNPSCPAKQQNIIRHYASKQGMDIAGLSTERIDALYSHGYLKCVKDLYCLKDMTDKIVPILGPNLTSTILHNIEQSKTCSLDKFLVALGIPSVGKATAKSMAAHIWKQRTSNDPLSACDFIQDWESLSDIGMLTSHKINNYFEDNKDDVQDLLDMLNIIQPDNANVNFSLNKKSFCITGSMNKFKNRAELSEWIERCGGIVVSGVSSNTDYLINNDTESTSSKNKKAKKLNVPIISENELIQMTKDI